MTTLMLTERDVLGANALTGNVSTFNTESQLVEWKAQQAGTPPEAIEYVTESQLVEWKARRVDTWPKVFEYLISERGIRTPRQPIEVTVSPAWFGLVKKRLKALVQLPVDWDTYGGVPTDPRIAASAEALIEWFAVEGVPPPDVFADGGGGVQLEWHIRGIDVTIAFFASDEETNIDYYDVNEGGEPWSGPVSDHRLRTIRKRLLENP